MRNEWDSTCERFKVDEIHVRCLNVRIVYLNMSDYTSEETLVSPHLFGQLFQIGDMTPMIFLFSDVISFFCWWIFGAYIFLNSNLLLLNTLCSFIPMSWFVVFFVYAWNHTRSSFLFTILCTMNTKHKKQKANVCYEIITVDTMNREHHLIVCIQKTKIVFFSHWIDVC